MAQILPCDKDEASYACPIMTENFLPCGHSGNVWTIHSPGLNSCPCVYECRVCRLVLHAYDYYDAWQTENWRVMFELDHTGD